MASLTGVSETLLIPLYARYLETQRVDSIIKDKKSIEIVKTIDFDFSKFTDMWMTQIGVAIRTEILDQEVKAFLEKNPNAIVVNLGAGLCTRFFRVDNRKVRWFELDLAQVKPIWENVMDQTDRHQYLAYSALDFAWMDQFKDHKREKFLFIAEGLLMYLSEAEVRKLVIEIKNNFPGSEMLFEAMSPFMAKNTNLQPAVSKTSAKFKWGIKSSKELEKWDRGIKFIDEWYYADRHKNRQGWMKLFLYIPLLRKRVKIMHVKLERN